MAAELTLCTQCEKTTGELIQKEIVLPTDLCWGHMKCGNCQLRWHVCLEHLRRWLWDDIEKARTHFCGPGHDISTMNDLSVSCLTSSTVISSDALNLESEHKIRGSSSDNCFGSRTYITHTTSKSYSSSKFTETSVTLPTRSHRYFTRESTSKGHGIQTLVGGAFRNDQDSDVVATIDESNFQLKVVSLLNGMSETKQMDLVDIFRSLTSNRSLFNTTRLPTTQCDIRKIYMTGIHSIFKNIPHPHVFTYDNHACVKLRDVIEHLVAHGLDFDSLDLEVGKTKKCSLHDGIKHTPAAAAICERVRDLVNNDIKPLVLYVVLWSDDFEVTHIKTTKSVWVHTVTVCPPKSQATSPCYTR